MRLELVAGDLDRRAGQDGLVALATLGLAGVASLRDAVRRAAGRTDKLGHGVGLTCTGGLLEEPVTSI